MRESAKEIVLQIRNKFPAYYQEYLKSKDKSTRFKMRLFGIIPLIKLKNNVVYLFECIPLLKIKYR